MPCVNILLGIPNAIQTCESSSKEDSIEERLGVMKMHRPPLEVGS